MGNIENALKLKDEGNSLFAKKEFLLAYEKYTAGIKEDNKNAVLYANRAACCLSMKRYLDAMGDAKQATELDPTYSKAWGRLGTTYQEMGDWPKAIDAMKRAVAALPVENLTASETKQKQQYQDALKQVEVKAQTARNSPSGVVTPGSVKSSGNLPWDRAREMLPELRLLGIARAMSSAWVIWGAYSEFSEGVKLMKDLKLMPVPNRLPGMNGSLKALEYITNGIVRDRRVFHMDDPNWVTKYNNQVIFESRAKKAWVEGGPSLILQEAQDRLSKKGWDHVRPALATTVRAWIMRGFMAGALTQDHRASVEWYENVLDVLERGRRIWRNVPNDERGTIFEDTFESGVRVLQLEAIMQAYPTTPGPDSEYSLTQLLEHAEDLLKHNKRSPQFTTDEYDPGFLSSFYVYPLANAFAMKGYYHEQMALHHSPSPKEADTHLLQAVAFYLDAAGKLPDDDELSYLFMSAALNQLWVHGTPLMVTLPLIARIREGIPKMKRIWEHSGLARDGRDKVFHTLLRFEEATRAAIREGKLAEDAEIGLESMNL